MAKLTDSKIKSLKASDKQYWVAGENGLYLLVSRIGSKHFYYRGTISSKRVNIALGEYPYISLADASLKVAEFRTKIKQGIDPREEKIKLKEEAARVITFKEFGERYFNE
jgi:hypothetical protein